MSGSSPSHLSDAQMRMVLEISRLLAVPTDLDRLLCQIAEISCRLLNCERASIFLHDQALHELWTKVAIKSDVIRLKSDAGIVGHSFTHDELVCVHDPYNDPRFHREPDLHSGFVTRNLLSAPMKGLDGKPIGAIECVNKSTGVFGENDLSLIQLLADQAGVAVQRHQLQEQAVAAGAIQREMHLARRAQEKLIPKSAPPMPGLTAVGWTLPASVTGGDCFDLWKLPDGRLGVLLADASGHGLAPAMIVAQVRSLVRALSDLDPDPYRVLQRVNTRLIGDLEPGQFVTAFVGFVSPDGELNWFSAGQGPLMVRLGIDEALRVIDPPVQPLGIEEWKPMPRPDALRVHPGGQIILVSDGIFESANLAGEMFGFARMTAALDQAQRQTPIEVLTALREAVRHWLSGGEAIDDETIVVVQRDQRTATDANR